jgi:hypothetical protein
MGPKLTYDFGLSEALRLQVSGTALFSSADQYNASGVTLASSGIFSIPSVAATRWGSGLAWGLRESASGSWRLRKRGFWVELACWSKSWWQRDGLAQLTRHRRFRSARHIGDHDPDCG